MCEEGKKTANDFILDPSNTGFFFYRQFSISNRLMSFNKRKKKIRYRFQAPT